MHDKPKLNFDLEKPSTCYLLGYFWADCGFSADNLNRFAFSFEIISKDMEKIYNYLLDMGFCKFKKRKRHNSIKELSVIRAARKADMIFFEDAGFHNRLLDCQLYYKLNENMKPFFIKGFLDGDGSISYDKNNLFRVIFYGGYDQNWNFLSHFCGQRQIPFKIYRKTRKSYHSSHKKAEHLYSVFEIASLQGKVDFCKSLPIIGLERKIDIFHKFRQCREAKQSISSNILKIVF